MTPTTFRTRLRALGLTSQAFADMTGLSVSTVKGWGTERGGRLQQFPGWVPVLLDCLDALREAGARQEWVRGFGRREKGTR